MTRTSRLPIPHVLLRTRSRTIAAYCLVAAAMFAGSLAFASESGAAPAQEPIPATNLTPDGKASAAPPESSYLQPLIAVRDAVAAEKPLTPMEDRVLDRVFRRSDAVGQATAAWFMRSAVVQMRPVDGAILGGFYNPICDNWLLARFDYVNGAWRLSEAFLAESPGASPNPWFVAGHEAMKEMVKNYGLAQRGFADRKAAFLPIDADTVLARSAPWLKSLDDWRGQKDAVKTAARVTAAIAKGKTRNLGLTDKTGLQLMDQLPASSRSGFAVQGVAARKDGATLFMVSPLAPSVLVLVNLAPDGGLRGVSVVDLAKETGVGA